MARPKTAPNRKQLCLDDDVEAAVEEFRFEQRLPSESAALRELVTLGLAAHRASPKRPVGRKARATN